MTKILRPQFSIYKNYNESVPFTQISLEEVYQLFLTGHKNIDSIREKTELYIHTGDQQYKNEATDLKSGLPIFTPGGIFGFHRKDKDCLVYSGVVQVDIDMKVEGGLELAERVKAALCNLPMIALCAISPSGVGVKALVVSDNKDVKCHKELVYQVCAIVEQTIAPIVGDVLPMSKIVDRCGKALSQPMYITFDADTYYNTDYQVFNFVHVDGWDTAVKKKKVAKAGSVIRVVKDEGVLGRPVDAQIKAINSYVRKLKARPKTADHPGGFRHGTDDARSLIGFANRIGCDEDVVREWMINDGWEDQRDICRVAEMYRTYSAEYGIGYNREVEVQAIIPEIPDEECVFVPSGGFLSDVLDGRSLQRSTHIIAPTGSGKTHLQFDGKQIWVFPTTALCTQFLIAGGTVKNAWTVFGDAPCPEGSREMIITTYDSFNRVCREIDISNYVVILDEVHNFVTASSVNYKLKALRNTLGWLPKAKMVVTLTATPFPNQITTFEDYDTMIVKKKDSFKRTVKLIASEESRRSDVVNRVVARGNFSLIFLQKTDRNTLIPWENEFASKGKKAVFINSRKKGSDEFYELVSKQQVDEGCVYIATSVIAEGVSVQTELDTVDVYIMGAEHPAMIEQMARRFRKIKELNVFLLTNSDDVSSGVMTVDDLEVAAADRREQMSKLAVGMITAIEVSGLALEDANITGAPVYEDTNGVCKVDELLIENHIFQNECALLSGNKRLCMELLSRKYGYEIVEEVESMNESTKFWHVDMANDEMIEVAKNIAIGKLYGGRFEEPNDEVFIDVMKKYDRFVKKITNGLPGITKLGKNALRECFDAFKVWNDKRSDWFITYVRILNSGCEVRNKFRQLVMKYCVGVPLTSEEVVGYGSILFDHEMLSATDREKSEFMSSVLLAHEVGPISVRTVKNVPKIVSSGSGDDVEVVGMEAVKSVVKMKKYTPVAERIAFEPALMSLNIFGYKNSLLSANQVAILTDDEEFKNEVLAIPGFTF